MTEYTAFIKLIKPNFNVAPWHDEVNYNFDAIDATLHALTGVIADGVWENSTGYVIGQKLFDPVDGSLWLCQVNHTSRASGLMEDDRTDHPTYWAASSAQTSAILDAISALSPVDGSMIRFTSATTAAVVASTAYGRSLLNSADAAALRTLAALGSLATLSNINDGNWSGTDLAVANGGTGASSAATARSNLGAAALASSNIFTADQLIQFSDDGAGLGPQLILERISASPAVSDFLGGLILRGRDSAGNVHDYGVITGSIESPTNGAELGTFRVQLSQGAGVLSTRMTLTSAGNLTVSGTVSGTSDERLKYNFDPIENALDEVMKWVPSIYERFANPGVVEAGLIAQSMESATGSVGRDDNGYLTVNPMSAIAYLTQAVQELARKIK